MIVQREETIGQFAASYVLQVVVPSTTLSLALSTCAQVLVQSTYCLDKVTGTKHPLVSWKVVSFFKFLQRL